MSVPGSGKLFGPDPAGLGGSKLWKGELGWTVDAGVTAAMGSGRKILLLSKSCWGGSRCGNGECGCTGVAGVTGDMGGGVTDTFRRSWADGSSNLRAGDFQELVVVVV